MQQWVLKTLLAAALTWPAGAALRAQTPEAQERAAAEAKAAEQHLQDSIRHRAAVAQGQQLTTRAMVARTKTEKAAWLGVQTSNVPGVIRLHLKDRNKYAGLLVEHVEPESPAAEAGLQQFDIIEKVGDQWIVNKEQFGAVLRMQKPGDPVTLAIIREGQPTEVTAKLIEKDLPVLALGGVSQIEMVPVDVEAGVMAVAPNGQVLIQGPKMEPMVPIQKWVSEPNSELKVQDDEHILNLVTRDGQRHLRATDAAGKVLFDGPINTEEEWEGIPADVRKKVEGTLGSARVKVRRTPTTRPAAPQR